MIFAAILILTAGFAGGIGYVVGGWHGIELAFDELKSRDLL